MTYPRVLKLNAWKPTIEGAGESLVLKLDSYKPTTRDTRGRWTWRGEVRLSIDRFFIKRLAIAIAEMQTRDRARLADELARLDHELAPLRKTPTEET